jgi:hypothetical protein
VTVVARSSGSEVVTFAPLTICIRHGLVDGCLFVESIFRCFGSWFFVKYNYFVIGFRSDYFVIGLRSDFIGFGFVVGFLCSCFVFYFVVGFLFSHFVFLFSSIVWGFVKIFVRFFINFLRIHSCDVGSEDGVIIVFVSGIISRIIGFVVAVAGGVVVGIKAIAVGKGKSISGVAAAGVGMDTIDALSRHG